jgi:hypothetical protein
MARWRIGGMTAVTRWTQGNANVIDFDQRPITQRRVYRRRRLAAAIVGVGPITALALPLRSLGGAAHASRRVQTRARARVTLAVREHEAIQRVRSYAPAITSGGSHGDEVALTFDDGPGPYTERLVGVLNKLGVKATFFAIGEEERYFSAGTRLEVRSGDAIGDHTETHPMMAKLSAHEQQDELSEQIARMELQGAPRPQLFRPPYGSFNATTYEELRKMGLLMVLWSTDTSDYTLPGVATIAHSALAGVTRDRSS